MSKTTQGSETRDTAKFRRRADARPDELLDAAKALFLEKGFAATKVSDVAKRAGVTVGTVYLYFPSKTALLEQTILRELADTAPPPGQAEMPGSPRAALIAVLRGIGQRFAGPEVLALPRLVLGEVAVVPELAALYKERAIGAMMPRLIGLVEAAIEAGEFRKVDPELAFRTLLGGIVSYVIMAAFFDNMPKGGFDLPRFVEAHLDIVLRGLDAEPAKGDEPVL